MGSKPSQDQVLAALSQPGIHGGSPVRTYRTHASVVFLAGDRAIKVKRAVRFPFLDYSTLERRKAACEAEVEVNRPFAPEIYLGVVPITVERDGSLEIDGNGEAVEWAVSMRRFNENETLDRLAERGELDKELSLRLADTVLDAHRAAPVADAQAWFAAFRRFVDQNHAAFASRPDLFPAADVTVLTSSTIAACENARDLLQARGARGYVKRLHGDLHLGNIVRIDGKPVLFDAIEFDPLIAAGDVLYDLAFLLMDLQERGLSQAASLVFNRYLERSGDIDHLEALKALPLFLSMRAAIRAKVTAARLEEQTSDQRRIADAARRYFRFALAALQPKSPMLVAIGGLSGTGKSVLARQLAPLLDPMPGAVVLRSDSERKRMFGVAEFDRLSDSAYTPDVSRYVYSVLAEKTRRVLGTGYSVVVDAVYADLGERSEIASAAGDVRFRGLFLVADTTTRLSRTESREKDVSDANKDVVLRQADYDLGHLDWIQIDASGTPKQTLDAAIRQLGLSHS